MYSKKDNLIIAFHGCKKSTLEQVLNHKSEIRQSSNDYDWLGSGIYFWEWNHQRAWEWANKKYGNEAAVLGAIISLGTCLDFLDTTYLNLLQPAYLRLQETYGSSNYNEFPKNTGFIDGIPTYRSLDCAVINLIIRDAKRQGQPFDSVRAAFWEGKEPYPHAGLKTANHIQLSIINSNCIKGFFLPRERTSA